MSASRDVPTINELGRDLLSVSRIHVAVNLAFPFLLTFGFFYFAFHGNYVAAFFCPVVLSFVSYGSISHDLVHRVLGLPRWLNEIMLSAIEMLTLRSGHAYRHSHLNHHAHYPAEDDLEGAASKMTILQSLIDGLTLQYRIYFRALKMCKSDRNWIVGEGIFVVLLFLASVVAIPHTVIPFVYCFLVIGGSWIFPLVTSYIPHNPNGLDELQKTKLYRGWMIRIIAFEHLYHLEHHLYPQIPHQNWPELARRLNPHFDRLGIKSLKLWF